ncbi:xanthine dehydrogenase molybdopterin binding subunit [Yunchengibacter salinarum]|uniref:xanthine dehydrogenase molybdopterin binding subunit n=1 Tax=Yunchengibacter salinarum TaxID=3133399 RepID=UPI0035B6A8AE
MPDTSKTVSRGISGGVHTPRQHDSGHKHVSGEALYTDDIAEPRRMIHLYVAMSPHAHGRIDRLDVSAVRAAPSVVDVITLDDIPGTNDASPFAMDDPIFADGVVEYAGQPLFAVAATSRAAAVKAAARADLAITPMDAVLTIDDALAANTDLEPPQIMAKGDSAKALETADRRLSGTVRMGGQDHFYLEGQIALATPGEDGDMDIVSSTQNPTEVQHIVAHALAIPAHSVNVQVRRMGGGFGGKETHPALFAAIAALAARKTGRPAKLRVDRDDDMIITGKRHDFRIDYDVGFDDTGRIQAIDLKLASRCGRSMDLSNAINDRAMFHSDNAYHLPHATITSRRLKTHTVSNTAFRGFGGPQGMVGIERVMDAIAHDLGMDPLNVRLANLYSPDGSQTTPYGMTVADSISHEIMPDLAKSAAYDARRKAVDAFNRENRWLKKGLALTPVKFGISFTTKHLNQAGALVHVYQDGSVHLNHGGTEMGQGLFVKVAQVVAETFQIDIDRVKITATTTEKVPNTSATAASSGSDLNGKAAEAAALTIRDRLTDFASEMYDTPQDRITFRDNLVVVDNREIPFPDLVKQAYLNRMSLSSTGFYATPKIHYDRETHKGHPFYYFCYGAALSEVVIDTLTGENRVLRVDLIHDVGKSLNPAIDLGQIEGGFIQGMGWLTTEELVWDAKGTLKTHAPSTYKIPACSDRPPVFNMRLHDGENREETIYRSKAVGEPPFMLAISVFNALTDAVAATADNTHLPDLDAPATPEAILTAIEALGSKG